MEIIWCWSFENIVLSMLRNSQKTYVEDPGWTISYNALGKKYKGYKEYMKYKEYKE